MSYFRRLENVLKQIDYVEDKVNKDLNNEFSLSNSISILLDNGDGSFDPANSFPVGDRSFSVA